jgi:hypothetical protein
MDQQAELSEFFEQFGLAYSSLSVDAVSAMFVLPFSTNVQGDITNWTEFEPLRQTTQILFNWYYQQGFRSARYTVVDQVLVGSEHATMTLRWHVAREDLHYWVHETAYQLRRVDGDWKICGIMQITTPEVLAQILQEEKSELWSPLAQAEEALQDEIPRPSVTL